MRVLYFTEGDSPHDRRFLKALSETEHHVFVLRQFPCDPQTPENITEWQWPLNYPDWAHWQGWEEGRTQFQSILLDIQPDVVHAGPVQGPAFLASLVGFQPLLTMSWGSDLLVRAKRSPWMRHVTQFTLSHTKIFLADCQTVADETSRYGFPAEEIVRFPWGVDLDHFSAQNGLDAGQALRRSLGWEDRFVMMCNRTWSPIYGVDVLARAFASTVLENEDLRLLLIGDGPLSGLIREILDPVMDKVHLPGWLSRGDLPGAYCASDLFISPSHSDGSSISLLEALACGRPVLVSDIPSNREWVKPCSAGELFSDGKVSDLKDQILQLAVNPSMTHYGLAARKLAEERADWAVNFQKLLDAYQRALR
jgi:glycosyltransferase involved in cell wall biosynthesis